MPNLKSLAQKKIEGPISENTYNSTLNLLKEWTGSDGKPMVADGTCFLIHKFVPDGSKRIFLVTNKHEIGNYTLSDPVEIWDKITAVYYREAQNPLKFYVPLRYPDGEVIPLVHFHNDQLVDVGVYELTPFYNKLISLGVILSSIPFEDLLPYKDLISYRVNLGTQLYVAGYPYGLKWNSEYKPLIKNATVSAPIDEKFDILMTMKNLKGEDVNTVIKGKIILVDGNIIQGNSGGPAFTPITETKIKNKVVGVVASSYAAGLSVIYSSDYIIDLINECLALPVPQGKID